MMPPMMRRKALIIALLQLLILPNRTANPSDAEDFSLSFADAIANIKDAVSAIPSELSGRSVKQPEIVDVSPTGQQFGTESPQEREHIEKIPTAYIEENSADLGNFEVYEDTEIYGNPDVDYGSIELDINSEDLVEIEVPSPTPEIENPSVVDVDYDEMQLEHSVNPTKKSPLPTHTKAVPQKKSTEAPPHSELPVRSEFPVESSGSLETVLEQSPKQTDVVEAQGMVNTPDKKIIEEMEDKLRLVEKSKGAVPKRTLSNTFVHEKSVNDKSSATPVDYRGDEKSNSKSQKKSNSVSPRTKKLKPGETEWQSKMVRMHLRNEYELTLNYHIQIFDDCTLYYNEGEAEYYLEGYTYQVVSDMEDNIRADKVQPLLIGCNVTDQERIMLVVDMDYYFLKNKWNVTQIKNLAKIYKEQVIRRTPEDIRLISLDDLSVQQTIIDQTASVQRGMILAIVLLSLFIILFIIGLLWWFFFKDKYASRPGNANQSEASSSRGVELKAEDSNCCSGDFFQKNRFQSGNSSNNQSTSTSNVPVSTSSQGSCLGFARDCLQKATGRGTQSAAAGLPAGTAARPAQAEEIGLISDRSNANIVPRAPPPAYANGYPTQSYVVSQTSCTDNSSVNNPDYDIPKPSAQGHKLSPRAEFQTKSFNTINDAPTKQTTPLVHYTTPAKEVSSNNYRAKTVSSNSVPANVAVGAGMPSINSGNYGNHQTLPSNRRQNSIQSHSQPSNTTQRPISKPHLSSSYQSTPTRSQQSSIQPTQLSADSSMTEDAIKDMNEILNRYQPTSSYSQHQLNSNNNNNNSSGLVLSSGNSSLERAGKPYSPDKSRIVLRTTAKPIHENRNNVRHTSPPRSPMRTPTRNSNYATLHRHSTNSGKSTPQTPTLVVAGAPPNSYSIPSYAAANNNNPVPMINGNSESSSFESSSTISIPGASDHTTRNGSIKTTKLQAISGVLGEAKVTISQPGAVSAGSTPPRQRPKGPPPSIPASNTGSIKSRMANFEKFGHLQNGKPPIAKKPQLKTSYQV